MSQAVISRPESVGRPPETARARRAEGAAPSPQPLRRRRVQPPAVVPSPLRRRLLNYVLALITVVLVVDALVGDKGLLETIRARRQYDDLAASLAALKQQNGRLRDDIRRLKEDPATIESIAREELGLMRPGEVLVVVRDAAAPR